MSVTKKLMVAIDFHSTFFHSMEVNGYRQLLHTGLELFDCE